MTNPSPPPKAQRVRGTQDIFGEDAARFDQVTAAFNRVRRLYGFRPVHLPVFEFTQVFARSLGETSDVVGKEMYSFEDRGGEGLTLRPEFTAGIARAFISEGWKQFGTVKLAAWGPVFRYERPQKGRYRQFHQLDAEILGQEDAGADIEVLTFAAQLLAELGIADDVTLELNTLGDAETRTAWREALVQHFNANVDVLSEDSRSRLERNPMRILDSKAPQDRPVADAAPGIDSYLTSEAGAFFEAVTRGLDSAGVRWRRKERLVRGLDYYRHTAFEFVTDRLGAQGTVLAGGRYDGLVAALGGPPTPGIGWAAGIERLAMLIDPPAAERADVAIAVEDDRAQSEGYRAAALLRHAGLAVELVASGSPRKRFDRAAAVGAATMLVLGHDGAAVTKRLRGEQLAQLEELLAAAN